jgi:alanyl-tRNA synthetase
MSCAASSAAPSATATKLGQAESFFFELVAPLAAEMGDAFPELPKARERVAHVLRLEEERFAETLEQGMRILEQAIAGLAGAVIPGETVFKLYDTYGFPLDLTADIARERGLTLDTAGFDREMDRQKERARAASHFGAGCRRRPATGGRDPLYGL